MNRVYSSGLNPTCVEGDAYGTLSAHMDTSSPSRTMTMGVAMAAEGLIWQDP